MSWSYNPKFGSLKKKFKGEKGREMFMSQAHKSLILRSRMYWKCLQHAVKMRNKRRVNKKSVAMHCSLMAAVPLGRSKLLSIHNFRRL